MDLEVEMEQGLRTYFKLTDHLVKENHGGRKGIEI